MSRPPYLAVELDAKKKMPQVARAAGLDVGAVAWGLLELWEHVWMTKRATVTRIVLTGCFGGSPEIVEALLTYGFLEAVGNDFKVKGAAEKLLGIWAAQSAAGKSKVANLLRPVPRGSLQAEPPAEPVNLVNDLPAQPTAEPVGSRPALTPITHHLSSSSKEEVRAPPAEPSAEPRQRKLRVIDEPADKFATAEAFWLWFQSKRQGAQLVVEKPPHPRALSAWWSEALGELNGAGERLEAAAFAFAEDLHWQKAKPPVPFGAFMSQWRSFVPQGGA